MDSSHMSPVLMPILNRPSAIALSNRSHLADNRQNNRLSCCIYPHNEQEIE